MLEGARVALRHLAESDLPVLPSIVAEPEVARWWGRFDEAKPRETTGGEGAGAWTVELGGRGDRHSVRHRGGRSGAATRGA